MSDEPIQKHQPAAPSRLRRFFLRHVPLVAGGAVILLALVLVQLYFYASSDSFQNLVRERLASSLSRLTGGRVEIATFHWRLLSLEAEAGGIVIHGREASTEAPYASIDRLSARLSLLGFFTPRVRLNDLEIEHPTLHLIVYPDGTTNQPQPRRQSTASKPAVDRLFDLKAGYLAVNSGVLRYDNRAASFDFRNRYIPIDFEAENVSLRMSYLPPAPGAEAAYRIETAASALNLARGAGKARESAVHGRMQAALVLTRNAVRLESLQLTALGAGNQNRVLEVTGVLQDFNRPRWQAQTRGDLDMRLIESATGYPNAPEGIARLDLAANGSGVDFHIDGHIHVDGGSYIGTGVVARGITLDARVQADPLRLLVSDVVARLRGSSGEMTGAVDLLHWRPPAPNPTRLVPTALPATRGKARSAAAEHPPVTIQAADQTIPVDGKVTAQLHNLSLDSLLDMVSQPPFQRLGIDALLNGPAQATWSKGDDQTVVVNANLVMAPSGHAVADSAHAGHREVPATGAIDATYTQRDGSVEVRAMQLHLPQSSIHASGRLGAYPMTSPTALTVALHTQNLGEFDTVLRDLKLERSTRAGAEALPARLSGEADFSGSWTGSLLDPRIAGSIKATQFALEIPPAAHARIAQPRFISFDSAMVTGSYSDMRIAIEHGLLQRGAARISLSGAIEADVPTPSAPGVSPRRRRQPVPVPTYDSASAAHLNVQAQNIALDDLRPFLESDLPATGTLNAQFAMNGSLNAPNGSGWLELANGSIDGQPFSRTRAQGALDNRVLKLAAVTVNTAGGTVTGAASYDLAARRMQFSATTTGIELAQIVWLGKGNFSVTGKLAMTASGSGALSDPLLEGHAKVTGLVVEGEALGSLDAEAHTANHALQYRMKTLLAGAELNLHGQTALHGDYATDNHLEFSRLDVGALLKRAHIDALSGESALAGTMTMAGPLAHPDQLHGEARLAQLAVTLAGVHLQGEGGVRAALAAGRVRLEPVHVTGEDTDLHLLGSMALTGVRQFDLATSGTINLKLAETLDPDLTASGTTTFEVEAHGTVQNPGLRGRIDIHNGSLSLEDLPNGLSQMQGTLQFNQNRLEVRTLTAMTGGGLLSVGGSLTYQHGFYADLSVTGKGVRIRYPQGVSSLADADLHLQGPETNLLLSGNVLITRFATSPDLDLASLAAQASAKVQTVEPANAPSNHVRLDIHLTSSPQLNFQNAFAKLAGDVDLRLRGTIASPSLLGRVSIAEGSAVIAGTRYDLQRGDITLTNPVRIEPVIDLTATAHVEDYDITLGLHGTPQKLSVTYRSDPPLPEADVVSLLALGHTQDQERLYTQQQEQELANPATDALLGGALNATVSSRMQKLFGAGSVKVDPDYLGAFGNSTSRITVQEQVGRNLILTYATDVNTTGQQLLQAEFAINRHVSLVVARDEAGVFSMVIKATRRYR